MKLQFFIFASFLAAVSYAQNCVTLDNGDAPIWSGLLSSIIGEGAEREATLQSIADAEIPAATSTCAASTKLGLFDALGAFNKCGDVVDEVCNSFSVTTFECDVKPVYATLMSEISAIVNTSSSVLDSVFKIQDVITAVDDATWTRLSNLGHDSNGLPRCMNGVIDLLFKSTFKNSCCNDFKAKFLEYSGSELSNSFIKDSIFKILDIVLTKVQVDGKSVSCAQNMVASLDANTITYASAFTQTPNNQACAASNGLEFLTTTSEAVTYSGKMGCCAKAVDEVVSIAKDLPIVAQYTDAKLFNEGTCWKPEQAQIDEILSKVTDAELKATLTPILNNGCFHLANGFSAGCSFDPSTCAAVPRS